MVLVAGNNQIACHDDHLLPDVGQAFQFAATARQRRFGKFEIRAMITCPVQFREAKARYSDGLIRIELPKIDDRRQKKSVVPVEIV